MRKNIITKAMAVVSMLILSALGFINSVYATNINTANIYAVRDCGNLLTYKGTQVKVTYVEYINEGKHYPAYCMDKTKGEGGSLCAMARPGRAICCPFWAQRPFLRR